MIGERRLHPSIVLRSEGDARFAFHLDSGEVLDLNETAALLLGRLTQGASADALADALVEAYPDVGRAEALRDVEDLLVELQGRGFLS